jgi:hypothetical protein
LLFQQVPRRPEARRGEDELGDALSGH